MAPCNQRTTSRGSLPVATLDIQIQTCATALAQRGHEVSAGRPRYRTCQAAFPTALVAKAPFAACLGQI